MKHKHAILVQPQDCMNPFHFNLIHHLHHLSHACTLITQPTITTDNVHYRTPEATPIGLVHTHMSRAAESNLHWSQQAHHVSMVPLQRNGPCVPVIIGTVGNESILGGR